MRWLLSGGALVLLAASCASPRSAAETRASLAELGAVPTGVARVCVIRPERAFSHVTMEVRDNGRLVGATRGPTFFCWLAAPGEHQITSIDDDTGPTLLDARADARYWLHQEVSSLGEGVHA